jgi:hypothetical protein
MKMNVMLTPSVDRMAIINGMGGAIERIVVGGETLSYAQFVGLLSKSRHLRYGECDANHPATNDAQERIAA